MQTEIHGLKDVEVISQGQSQLIRCVNTLASDMTPAGGTVTGNGLAIVWQDGPRWNDKNGMMDDANGAFVEDAILAARQRLAFLNAGKFNCPENSDAITHLDVAIKLLDQRAMRRLDRNVLGRNEA